jgi:hypothetical protein
VSASGNLSRAVASSSGQLIMQNSCSGIPMRKSVAKVPHRSSHSRSKTNAITRDTNASPKAKDEWTATRAPHFSSAAKNALNNHRSPIRTKTASEQSSPKSENSPRKLRELMKRNAGFGVALTDPRPSHSGRLQGGSELEIVYEGSARATPRPPELPGYAWVWRQ